MVHCIFSTLHIIPLTKLSDLGCILNFKQYAYNTKLCLVEVCEMISILTAIGSVNLWVVSNFLPETRKFSTT